MRRRPARARARDRRRRPRGARRGSGRRADREGDRARVGRAARASTPPTPDVDGPARRTSPRSSTPAAPPARRRAACSATTTTRRSPARSASAGTAPPTTWCGRRSRCSTTTRSSPRCSARSCSAGAVGDLPAVLGVELLARDEPRRRHHHVDARHDGVPPRPRRRPARDAAVGRARGEHDACACSARRRCPVEVDDMHHASASASTTFSGAYGVTEASLISWQPPGVAQQAERGRRHQRRVLRRPHLRRRRQRAAARRPTARSSSGPSGPHVMFEGYWGRPEATVGDQPQLVVPHRRHRPDRRRRLPLLRRPQGRLPPPPGREHLELRGREHPDGPRRARRRRRARGAERDDRGRPQDHRDPRRRARRSPRRSCSAGASTSCPYFALPRYIEFRTELPRSPVGRVLKRELRDEGVTATTWDAEAAGITYEKR